MGACAAQPIESRHPSHEADADETQRGEVWCGSRSPGSSLVQYETLLSQPDGQKIDSLTASLRKQAKQAKQAEYLEMQVKELEEKAAQLHSKLADSKLQGECIQKDLDDMKCVRFSCHLAHTCEQKDL